MKLDAYQRMLREDVSEAPDWVEKLIDHLNYYLETTIRAVRGEIAIGDNLQAQTKFVYFTTNATGGVTDSAGTGIRVPVTLPRVSHVFIGSIHPASGNRDTLTTAVTLDWQSTGKDQILIRNITGLSNSTAYNLTLLVM